jgi:DNA polymerase eta
MIAVNYPAREFGIQRGDSSSVCRTKCPSVRLVHVEVNGGSDSDSRVDRSQHKVSLQRYREASEQIFELLDGWDGVFVEKASIDEAFIDVTEAISSSRYDEDLFTLSDTRVAGDIRLSVELQSHYQFCVASILVKRIREDIFSRLGFTCSAGISHNKLLSKLGSSLFKPNKQAILVPEVASQFLNSLPVEKLRGLGGKVSSALKSQGIIFVSDAIRLSRSDLQKFLARDADVDYVFGALRGTDTSAIVPRSRVSSMLAAKSFPASSQWSDLDKWLTMLCEEISKRIVRDRIGNGRIPQTLTVHHGGERGSHSRSCPMPSRCSDPKALFDACKQQLARSIDLFPVFRISVHAGNFRNVDSLTLDSFFHRHRNVEVASDHGWTGEATPQEAKKERTSIRHYFTTSDTSTLQRKRQKS